jgi:surface polysaccharide O-acyltransferase-like enzyme
MGETACRRAVLAGEATSPPDVELRVEALLHGDFLFALPLFVVLSPMLALGARAEENRIALRRLCSLAYHRRVVSAALRKRS